MRLHLGANFYWLSILYIFKFGELGTQNYYILTDYIIINILCLLLIVSMFLTRKTNFRFLVNLLQFATIDDYDQVALFYQVEIALEWLQLPYLSREITLGHALNVCLKCILIKISNQVAFSMIITHCNAMSYHVRKSNIHLLPVIY